MSAKSVKTLGCKDTTFFRYTQYSSNRHFHEKKQLYLLSNKFRQTLFTTCICIPIFMLSGLYVCK